MLFLFACFEDEASGVGCFLNRADRGSVLKKVQGPSDRFGNSEPPLTTCSHGKDRRLQHLRHFRSLLVPCATRQSSIRHQIQNRQRRQINLNVTSHRQHHLPRLQNKQTRRFGKSRTFKQSLPSVNECQ
jgi:hypothetical protein